MEGTPVLNKQPTTCPLRVYLADGRQTMSTHMCDVKIDGLPFVLTGHIIPDLSIVSLFGIRLLTEAGCTITFDKKFCSVQYNGTIILQGKYSNVVKHHANWNACYSCGFHVPNNHTSVTCPTNLRKALHNIGFNCQNAQQYIDLGHPCCTKNRHKTQFPANMWQSGAANSNVVFKCIDSFYVNTNIFLYPTQWCLPTSTTSTEEDNMAMIASNNLLGSWGRRSMAVAGEVTRHGQSHPYSWLITIVSLRSKESEGWTTEVSENRTPEACSLLSRVSSAYQSHFHLVLSLREASRKYIELSPSTPPFLTLQFHEKDLTPTPNLLRIRPILPPLGHILSVPSRSFGWHGSVGWSCKPTVGSYCRCHGQLHLQACGVWRH